MKPGGMWVGVGGVSDGSGEEGDGIRGGVRVAGSRPHPFTFSIKSRIIMLSVLQSSEAV